MFNNDWLSLFAKHLYGVSEVISELELRNFKQHCERLDDFESYKPRTKVNHLLAKETLYLSKEYQKLKASGKTEEATEAHLEAWANYRRALSVVNGHRERFNRIRQNARHRGIEFSLTIEDYINLCEQTLVCPILGIELDYSILCLSGGKKRPNVASLDRIDNTKGYTTDNVQIISWAANLMKTDNTEEQLAEYVLAAVSWAKRKLGEHHESAKV